MRWLPIALAPALLACSKPESERSVPPPPSAIGEARTAPKKAVDAKPLPPLAKDPGSSGKPLAALGFGGVGTEHTRDVAVSPAGDAYVVGYFDGTAEFGAEKRTAAGDQTVKRNAPTDAFLTKVGADGKLAWTRTFGAARDDVANGVAIRGNTIVVVGSFLDTLELGPAPKKSAGSDDVYVAAFDPAGQVKWVWHAGGIDSDGANTVAATPDGGWIVGGSFSKTAAFGSTELTSKGQTDAMLIKLGASGDLEWVKTFGGRYMDRIRQVRADGQGNLYVLGEFKDVSDWGGGKPLTAAGGADFDIVLAKYDLNGDPKWAQRFGDQFDEMGGGLTVDPAGNVAITGAFRRHISFGAGDDHMSLGEADIFVARFDPQGKLAWARTYGAERDDAGMGIASDAAGNTILTGWFVNAVDFGLGPRNSVNRNRDVFALKLDAQGTLSWLHTFGDKDHDQGSAIAVDDKGVATLIGIYRFRLALTEPALESRRADDDRIPKSDAFLVRLDR